MYHLRCILADAVLYFCFRFDMDQLELPVSMPLIYAIFLFSITTIPSVSLQGRQQALGHTPRLLREHHVHHHQRGHGLNDGHRPRHHTGVVPPLGGQDAVAGAVVHGRGLLLADGGGGLEADAEVDGGAVGDAALDAAAEVGLGRQPGPGQARPVGARLHGVGRLGRDEGVVVDRAGHLAPAEPGPDLEALGRGDRQHGVREHGLDLVEARLAQAGRRVLDDARHRAADAVRPVAEVGNVRLHLPGDLLVGAPHGEELVHRLAVDGLEELEVVGVRARGRVLGRGGEQVLGADARDEGDDLDAVGQLQVLLGDGAGGHSADRLPCAAPSATGRGLDAVFLQVGPVCVRGSGEHVHGRVAVVLGSLVLVQDQHADRCAQRHAELGAGLDLDTIFLVTRGGNCGLAGATSRHLGLDIVFSQEHARRAAVDYAAD